MTMKSIPITFCFVAITISQCVIGITMTAMAARTGGEVRTLGSEKPFSFQSVDELRCYSSCVAQPQPPIPLDSFHLCLPSQPNRHLEVAFTSLSLCYGNVGIIVGLGWVPLTDDVPVSDVLAFLMVTFLARKAKVRGIRVATLLDTIAKDATWYFMVIFTSHFVLVMCLNLGRVSAVDPTLSSPRLRRMTFVAHSR